ncbi:glycogen debranching protein GlgX [Acuticoccus sp. I52.16.1]|uniref:glycogen debranching protein GlgX n=1 Tax=Acuticoccus sp. I52.16.1 TaxID=2928472 RepID=UPI001FD25876|nr:glycogen debranching protein GlgX [Acuticoccus sp. I52.16.1]UOM36174.1 glycogen debranching protein GlgX [Acuticoccus sp. I52.16.1]
MRIEPGSPGPLGATWDGSGTNFALFSANATNVELCLFERTGRRETNRIPVPEHTHDIWHCYLPDVRPGQLYGYRVHGPYEPSAGHRFNPNKLLIDPYARALKGDLRWQDSMFGYRVGSTREDLSFDRRDSGPAMPKSIVVDEAFTWGNHVPPQVPWTDTIVYEAHVKGMTAMHPDVPDHMRGTFAGLADPQVIDYLVKLGVTTIELMPIHYFPDDRHLLEKGLHNYWGYNTLNFFAPAARYISRGSGHHEFKHMVRRLHEAGIEVILDVVYNHTAEGNQLGPTLSFKGIDNASYYVLAEDKRYYSDTTGTGNTVNVAHPRVMQMVMDSLRYWVEVCKVDGFRFDLAPSMSREGAGFDKSSAWLDAVMQDPTLQGVKMIAEPWDLGMDGYQVGNFPPGWAEWNGRYRDDIRSYWRGESGYLPPLASNVLGSADIFDHAGRKPWASVNFVTAHDGFTLVDLVTYNEKHNEGNGEDNRDGHGDNRSFNWGVEGPTDDEAINTVRTQMRRNLIATLLVSQGTPMMLMGDEIGRSQFGNNNGYCQDTEFSWLNWGEDSEQEVGFRKFVADLIRVRQELGIFHQARFLHGDEQSGQDGAKDICWLRPDGEEMNQDDWHAVDPKVLGMVLAQGDARAVVFFNSLEDEMTFNLCEPLASVEWSVLFETVDGTVHRPGRGPAAGAPFTVPGRSMLAVIGNRSH